MNTATNCIFWGNEATGSTSDDYKRQIDIACTFLRDSTGTSRYNLIQDWECENEDNCCNFPPGGCECITTILGSASDPLFVDGGDPDDNPNTFEFNNYRLMYPSSPAINAGDPALDINADAGYFPLDEFDADDDAVTAFTEPYELAPAIGSDRVLDERISLGAYEVPCFIPACIADIVDSVTVQPPPDGVVDGADLAYVISEWGSGPSLADIVDTATLQPPPDGEVDGADLAVVIVNWGACPTECQDPYAESMMMTGSTNPFENTAIGDLLDQLMHSDDEEEAAALIAQLLELLSE